MAGADMGNVEGDPYVFISYAAEDREYVDRLTTHLHVHGVQTRVDHEGLRTGERWLQQLE